MERIAETRKLPIRESSTMTIRWTKAVVARPTSSRKQAKVTSASAMHPKEHCAAERQNFVVWFRIIRSTQGPRFARACETMALWRKIGNSTAVSPGCRNDQRCRIGLPSGDRRKTKPTTAIRTKSFPAGQIHSDTRDGSLLTPALAGAHPFRSRVACVQPTRIRPRRTRPQTVHRRLNRRLLMPKDEFNSPPSCPVSAAAPLGQRVDSGPKSRLPAQNAVGFVGLGHMGAAMAANLAAAGRRVVAYVRRADQIGKLAALGLEPPTDITDPFHC